MYNLKSALRGIPVVVLSLSALQSQAADNYGGCFNLQVIAMKKAKSGDMTSGNRIFIKADGSSDIFLKQGTFQVLDANGTDANGAAFQLPYPGSYQVYVRPVGKPGTSTKARTCVDTVMEDVSTRYCSTESELFIRSKGANKFRDVTSSLTTLSYDFDGDGRLDRVNLFDDLDALLGGEVSESYLWSLDAQGQAHLQMRFCSIQ